MIYTTPEGLPLVVQSQSSPEPTDDDLVLIREVYDFLAKAADHGCTKAQVLGGPPCGECLGCLAKPIEQKVRIRSVKKSWGRNPYDQAETYWEALYAIRGIAEHTGGKKATARRMRQEFEQVREIADNAIHAADSFGEKP